MFSFLRLRLSLTLCSAYPRIFTYSLSLQPPTPEPTHLPNLPPPNSTTVAITTIPGIFENVYHESVGIGGLNYIALGVGLTGFSQLNARTMDKIYVYLKNKNGGVGRPEFRLREWFFLHLSCFSICVLTPFCFDDMKRRWFRGRLLRRLDC